MNQRLCNKSEQCYIMKYLWLRISKAHWVPVEGKISVVPKSWRQRSLYLGLWSRLSKIKWRRTSLFLTLLCGSKFLRIKHKISVTGSIENPPCPANEINEIPTQCQSEQIPSVTELAINMACYCWLHFCHKTAKPSKKAHKYPSQQ